MYPDAYNGAWALCPDPIDFRSYRSVNIYDEHNAYYYEDNPWKRTPKPGYRDYRDHLYSTFEERNLVELVLGTHGRSAGQHDAWASVFGPVGDDGYYKPLYDKVTGAIDPAVAQVLARQLRPALHHGARLGDARAEAARKDPHHQRHDGQRLSE